LLNKLALALAVLIVVLLAAVAAIAISADRDETAENGESELSSAEALVEDRTTVAIGSEGQPLGVECQVPTDSGTPLLVSFLNATDETNDFLARITVDFADGTTVTALARAAALRPGERRAVVPEPWPDSGVVTECRLDAIQQGEHVILLDSGR
jgi:hypothetical protein